MSHYCQHAAVDHVFTLTQLLKQVNVQTPYRVVFKVVILVLCSVTCFQSLCATDTGTWSPVEKKDMEAIEKGQRRFTKRLSGLRDYSYSERLQMLNLQSLELRRIIYATVSL